jgi:hypothetical protein
MSCDNSTPNLYPVGVTYDSRNRPTGLAELSSVIVTNLSSTGTIKTNNIFGLSSNVVTFLGPVSATAYLGAGAGGGVSSFIELSDVEAGTVNLNPSYRSYVIAVNENGNLTTSSVSALNEEAGYINATSIANTYATTATVEALDATVVSIGDRVTLLEGETTSFSSLTDVTVTSPTNGNVVVWSSSVSKWVNIASSVLAGGGGGGVTTFIALTDTPSTYTGASSYYVKVNSAGSGLEFVADSGSVTYADADIRYVNASGDTVSGTLSATTLRASLVSATNSQFGDIQTESLTLNTILNSLLFTNNGNSVVGIPLDGDFTSGSIPAPDSFLGTNADASLIISYPKSDYVLSSTNTVLSSTVSNHIASADVHFYASSLSSNPGYALSSWTENRYSSSSHNHSLSSLTDVSTVSLLPNDYLSWNGSKWVNAIMPVTPNLGGLPDVDVADASTNDSLIYNGSMWVASPIDHGTLSGLLDNDHPQYVLSATNSNLSSTVSDHIASAGIHFYASSLSSNPGYALSSWTETQYINTSGDTVTGTPIHNFYSLSSVSVSATVFNVGSTSYGTGAPTGGNDGDIYFQYT